MTSDTCLYHTHIGLGKIMYDPTLINAFERSVHLGGPVMSNCPERVPRVKLPAERCLYLIDNIRCLRLEQIW